MKSDDDRIERGDLRRTLDMDGTLDFDFCIRPKCSGFKIKFDP